MTGGATKRMRRSEGKIQIHDPLVRSSIIVRGAMVFEQVKVLNVSFGPLTFSEISDHVIEL